MAEKQKRCIIYGGGGFIGSHIADNLLSKGYGVTIFDKLNFSHKNISHIKDSVKIIEGDFNNKTDLDNSLEGIDYVFHFVSSTLPASSNANPIYDVETNLVSSLRLFEGCLENKIKKVIFLSSGGTVYGAPENIPVTEEHSSHPICSYGIVKRTIEDYLFMFNKLYNLDYFVFRLANPYGERQNPFAAQGAIPVFIYKAIKNEPIEIWGNGEVVRDYIYIRDAAEILASSIETFSSEKVFNVSSGKGMSLNEIIKIIEEISGKKVQVNYTPSRSIDVPVSILDNSRAEKVFSWKPGTPVNEGIRRTYDYILNGNYINQKH